MSARMSNCAATCEMRQAVSQFTELKPQLLRIACRFIGSTDEAEDILQEAWIRWQTCDRSSVRSVPAFLCSVTRHLSINVVTSAHVRHETSIEDPEHIRQLDVESSPDFLVLQSESLQLATWAILERLSPTERAAFLLREVFDYPYEQIARGICQTNAGARQLVCRARRHLVSEPRFSVNPIEHQRLTKAFVAAACNGDMTELEDILVRGVRSTDSGSAVPTDFCGSPSEPGYLVSA